MTTNQRDLIAAIITLFIAEKVKDEDVGIVANDPRVVINTYKRVREKVAIVCEEMENDSVSL